MAVKISSEYFDSFIHKHKKDLVKNLDTTVVWNISKERVSGMKPSEAVSDSANLTV